MADPQERPRPAVPRGRTARGRRSAVCFGGLAAAVLLTACPGDDPEPTRPIKARSSGFLVVSVKDASDDQTVGRADGVFVPGVSVQLRSGGSDVGDPVRTDLSGRFRFPPQDSGSYEACWEADGLASDCEPFEIATEDVHLGPIAVRPDGDGTIFGHVRFADGSSARTLDPLANVNAFAKVRADAGATVREAFVNNYDMYVLPALQPSAPVKLKAVVENGSRALTVNPASIPPGGKRVDITFSNEPPKMTGLVGSAPGGRHWTAAPGDRIEIGARATDPDGDPLDYRWILPDGSAEISSAPGGVLEYQLPDSHGMYEFTAVASDGRGGYDREHIVVSTKGIRFSGTVGATDANEVAGAEVEVNGKTTTTNAEGFFSLRVDEAKRYVLNIRAPGYGLVSKIYDNGIVGGRWTLTRASVHSVDPTADVLVVNEREPSDCPGRMRDPRKEPEQRKCGPGISVAIRANSLVDENGDPPAGMVDVELTTVDPESPDGMPGDYTAITSGSDVRVMETYGAGTVEVTDGAHTFDLAPGAVAEVTIPIAPQQLAAAPPPPTVPLLFYDEDKGVWVEEGQMTLQGDSYVASVSHFSAINADELKVNQACLRLETVAMPPQFFLEATIPSSGGGAPSIRTVQIDNASRRIHVIYNLPTNATVGLRALPQATGAPFDLVGPGGASVTTLSAPTGGPQSPTTPNLPEFPYLACEQFVELIPFRLPPATRDQFLHGFSFAASNLTELDALADPTSPTIKAAAEAYYDTIDPQGLREDLEEFKTANGFGSGEITATYANSGDLGFGREMHCKKNGLDVACYVTNYGNRFTSDLDDFAQALNRDQPIATVGMEYSRVENVTGPGFQSPSRFVKFYVYKEALTSPVDSSRGNGRAISANLDGYGERPVPALCIVCHGGNPPDPDPGQPAGAPAWDPSDGTTGDIGSNFIPFDLSGFTLPVLNGVDHKATQQSNFRDLNWQIVLETNPPQATEDVVAAMYPGGATTSAPQVEGFVLNGWNNSAGSPSQQDVYSKIVGPDCRSCHISRGTATVASPLEWDDATQWQGGFIASLVCDQHVMPHAVVTHNRFWLSAQPHRPLMLHDYLNGASAPGTAGSTGINCFPGP